MTARSHKRSWKNLLLNKRYQLRFTLFMAGLAAVLMTVLGWWVIQVADEATTVAKSHIRGTPCPRLPDEARLPVHSTKVKVDVGDLKMEAPAAAPGAGTGSGTAVAPGAGTGTGSGTAAAPGAGTGTADPPGTGSGTAGSRSGTGSGTGSGTAGAGAGDDDDEHHRAVTLEQSSMTLTPIPPPPPAISSAERARILAQREACEKKIQDRLDNVDARRSLIILVMVGSGVVLTLGLAIFGIKMTHRVAGPLHKVTLYLGKMRDGRYDKVYDLRKGDQLIEFYEHFKHAHAGVVTMEQADIERIKAALDAVTSDGVLERSPEAAEAAAALRAILERKEASFG